MIELFFIGLGVFIAFKSGIFCYMEAKHDFNNQGICRRCGEWK